jgi:hypothetical protein
MARNEPRITHDNGSIVTFSDGAVHDRVNFETQHPGEVRPRSSRSGSDQYMTLAYKNTPAAKGTPPSRQNRSMTTTGDNVGEHPSYQRGLKSAQAQTQRRSGQ